MFATMRRTMVLLPIVAGLSLSSSYALIAPLKLRTSPTAPQLLGTTIHLTASASDSDPGPLTYKWEGQAPGSSSFSLMRDFDLETTLPWVPNLVEGTYQLRLTARDYLAGTSAQLVVPFQVNPLVTGTQPVAIPTANPLVALFSAPACPAGSSMSVAFQAQGSAVASSTDWRPCQAGTMNFYIAGMAASQTYDMTYQVNTGGTVTAGPTISFTAGSIPSSLPFAAMSVPIAANAETDAADGVLLTGYASSPDFPTATDLYANIIWYYPHVLLVTRPVPGGTLLSVATGIGTGTGVWGPHVTSQQIVREFDLAGNTVRETNCDRVYEQLTALGLQDPLSDFNHDAIRLPNGETMVLGDVQRIFPPGTQGSTVPVDVIGGVIVVLDQNFQVLGYWNSFDHACTSSDCLDVNRKGDLTCLASNPKAGCPPVLLLPTANDWLHANSLEYLPSDGDLLVSLRNQNWIIKIDYEDAAGTGGILWRLGSDGDFALNSPGGNSLWFSGQHDAGFVNDEEQTLMVFDDATKLGKAGGDSFGQVWNIDQTNMLASLVLNADLGAFSRSLGSAQLLLNGDYMFLAGNIELGDTIEAQNTEVAPDGTFVYRFQSVGTSLTYRGWRMPDLYTATLSGSSGPE
jgi:hypothetical protein